MAMCDPVPVLLAAVNEQEIGVEEVEIVPHLYVILVEAVIHSE